MIPGLLTTIMLPLCMSYAPQIAFVSLRIYSKGPLAELVIKAALMAFDATGHLAHLAAAAVMSLFIVKLVFALMSACTV